MMENHGGVSVKQLITLHPGQETESEEGSAPSIHFGTLIYGCYPHLGCVFPF